MPFLHRRLYLCYICVPCRFGENCVCRIIHKQRASCPARSPFKSIQLAANRCMKYSFEHVCALSGHSPLIFQSCEGTPSRIDIIMKLDSSAPCQSLSKTIKSGAQSDSGLLSGRTSFLRPRGSQSEEHYRRKSPSKRHRIPSSEKFLQACPLVSRILLESS